ncbi:MAG: S41 family peptidase [Methylacidiphilales bacterium]|nr:S41 family peptidase [Candidatus Methylacidiphilales bacterium]
MNILKLTLPSLLLLAGPLLLAEPPTVAPPNPADPLAEALPILQAKYIDFQALNYKPGDHLSDLIARSGGKITLTAPETASAPDPIITVTLPDNILYWRLASFTPEKSWADLGTQLEQASSSATGIILDLRSNVAPDDYHGVAQVVGLFDPEDQTLFGYEAAGGDHGVRIPDHPFRAPIIVLTNHETTGAAEALAACLKADGALVVGRVTAGKMGIFAEQKLSSGQVLRYVTGPVGPSEPSAGMERHSLAWDQPVAPDIGLTVNDHAEKAALTLIKDGQILDVIQESAERHRISEASLVHGEDPEWDSYLATLERKPVLLSLPLIHDVVLISALDSLKAIRFSERPIPAPAQVRADASPSTPSSVQ